MILVYGHHVNPVDFDGRTTQPNCWGPLGWGHLMIAASLVAWKQDSSLVQYLSSLDFFIFKRLLNALDISNEIEIHILFTFIHILFTDSPHVLGIHLHFSPEIVGSLRRGSIHEDVGSGSNLRAIRGWGHTQNVNVICMYKICVVYMYVSTHIYIYICILHLGIQYIYIYMTEISIIYIYTYDAYDALWCRIPGWYLTNHLCTIRPSQPCFVWMQSSGGEP